MSISRNDSTQAMRSLIGAYDDDDITSESDTEDDTQQSYVNSDKQDSETSKPLPLHVDKSPIELENKDSQDNNRILEHYSDNSDAYSDHSENEGDISREKYSSKYDDIEEDNHEPAKRSKLVSYDESILDSPKHSNEQYHPKKNILIDEEYDSDHSNQADDIVIKRSRSNSLSSVSDITDGDDVIIPPEPSEKCSSSLQDKIISFHLKMEREGIDLNSVIQERKDFRNPSIYEKLVQFCDIDEKGTNYPENLYDPHIYGPESYYEELSKQQKVEMDKLEKEKKDRSKVDFVPGMKKGHSSESDLKRKSKWDEPRDDKRKITINK